ncbi:outer membrane beta-barrel protein [Altererythrobacter ishigakiensis]|uniref:Putative beta-barrel porin 2 n=1 Tax=Altererythrobacter ishigakiensis TaxID=476157 RepID=A0A562UVY6_9SPHN|nr:outer membrane beta-barrel protein [Altererythrobacter ishigakiensis]TWJ09792.1 putative beta-barrel porin 2 [Altererythrobacter ishigakiensis]
MKNKYLLRALVGTVILVPYSASANDQWSVEIEAGAFYDSQLVVDEIDTQEDSGDIGFRLGADVEFEAVNTDAFDLEFGYDFGQTLYADNDEFDLQSHVADVNASTRIAGARVGARYAFSHFRLGGDSLFDMHTITPSVSGFVADGLFARAFYTYNDKNFATFDGRDATGNQVGASVFKFFSDNAGFISVSGRWEEEDAMAAEFDYDGFVVGADLRIPIAGGRGGTRVQFGVDYRDRDYKAVTPSINEVRTEDRFRGEVELTVPVNERLRLEAGYRYTDRNSNLPSADYKEHRVSAGMLFEL